MNAEKYIKMLLIPALLTGFALTVRGAEVQPPAAGNQKAAVGAIVGVVRNSAKAPIAGATVTSTKTDGTGLRATVSTSDGIYSFADVAPGEYSVSSQADGYLDTVVSAIQVVAAKATRTDIVFESVPA